MVGHLHTWIATIPGTCPVVPWKCPACPTDTLSNLFEITHKSGQGVPNVAGTHPQTVPGTLPRHTTHQIPSCVVSLPAFLLSIKQLEQGFTIVDQKHTRMKPGSAHGGLQAVVRVLCGGQFPLPPFNLYLTPCLSVAHQGGNATTRFLAGFLEGASEGF